MKASARRAVMTTLADGLRAHGYAATTIRRDTVLYWRKREDLPVGNTQLRQYSDNPVVWRWHVDHHHVFHAPARATRDLGTPRHWRLRDVSGPKLELSVLEDELLLTASWLPDWIFSRDAGTDHPAPPVPMQTPVLDYAWSDAADAYYSDHPRELLAEWHAWAGSRDVGIWDVVRASWDIPPLAAAIEHFLARYQGQQNNHADRRLLWALRPMRDRVSGGLVLRHVAGSTYRVEPLLATS